MDKYTIIGILGSLVFYLKTKSKNKAIILAVLPTMIFVISGILLRHWSLMLAGISFGIGHIYVTLQNTKR